MSKEKIYRLKVTSKRQVTFPKVVMDALKLAPGDVLEVRETQTGYALAVPQVEKTKIFPLQNIIPAEKTELIIEEFRRKGYEQSLRD